MVDSDPDAAPGPSFSTTSIEAPMISPVELDPTTKVPLISTVELYPTTSQMVDSDPDAAPMVPAAAPMVISTPSPSGSPLYSPSEGIVVPVEFDPTTAPMVDSDPYAATMVAAAAPMFISAPLPSGSPAYSPSEGIVVSAMSLSGSPSHLLSEPFESLSTSRRIVISATSLSGSSSYPPSEPFESPSTSRRIRSPSGSPSHSPYMPMKLSAKGPTPSGRIRTSSPPLGVGVISSISSEYSRPSPFTEKNVPGVAKRGRPGSPASSDVVPEAKRFAIATKADDAEVPEHLWDLRAVRVDGTLNTQEGNALTLLTKVLLQRWRRITTRSFLVYLNLEKVTHGIVKRDKGKYGWSTSGKYTYSTWWHGSPRAGNQDMEIGRDCVRRICDSSWWNWDGGSTPFFGVGHLSSGHR
jgi:hypothetical protein